MKESKIIGVYEGFICKESDTHYLDMDLIFGCAWIFPKNKDDIKHHFLPANSFHKSQIENTMVILRDFGFNIRSIND